MLGLNIQLADLQISDFHAPECCFLWWHTEKTFSFRGHCPQTPTRGFAPGPHWGPTAASRSPHHFPPFSLFPSPMSEGHLGEHRLCPKACCSTCFTSFCSSKCSSNFKRFGNSPPFQQKMTSHDMCLSKRRRTACHKRAVAAFTIHLWVWLNWFGPKRLYNWFLVNFLKG